MKKHTLKNHIQNIDKTLLNTKICSLIITLLPLLSLIRSPIPDVDMGTTVLLLVYFSNVISTKKFEIKRGWFDGIFYYILIVTPLALLFQLAMGNDLNSPFITILLRWGKILVSFFILFKSGAFDHLNSKYLIKYLQYISCAMAVMAIIQYIFYSTFGIAIKNPLLSLATYSGYSNNSYTNINGNLFRPSAFFFEPAHMAIYSMLCICYLLFAKNNMDIRSIIILVVCMTGVFFTGSGIGIMGIILLCILWIILKYKSNLKKSIPFVIAFILLLIILSFSEHMQLSLARVFTFSIDGGNAILGRIGQGYSLFWQSDIITKIIGAGYGNVWSDIYLNGWAYILNTMGLFGALIVGIQLFGKLKKDVQWKKIAGSMYGGLLIIAQLFSVHSFALYMFALCSKEDNKEITKLKKRV